MKRVQFTVTIHQFGSMGEKTGWTYFEVPADLAAAMKPGNRVSFRVKGKLDDHVIAGVALLPMGAGKFIMPLNAKMRKALGKNKGATMRVQLEEDSKPFKFNKDFLTCLADEPKAHDFFKTLPGSHQRYFSKWIDDAKATETRSRRIAMAVTALAKKKGYADMLRSVRKDKD